MDCFRKLGAQTHQIELHHIYTEMELLSILFDTGEPSAIPENDHVQFFLVPFTLGDELWCGVTASLNDATAIRIIEPFLVPSRDMKLVPLFREEC